MIEFIEDARNSSYDVRNQLMLVAPEVSEDAWQIVFTREPAMNEWHLAQALIANSPLSGQTMEWMEEYELNPYYEQLIENAQGGGINMESIYQSEIAAVHLKHNLAITDVTKQALKSGVTEELEDARQLHIDYPVNTSARSILGIDLALNDLTAARTLVDEQLIENGGSPYWEVQDLYVKTREQNIGLGNITSGQIEALRASAGTNEFGAAIAQAWLGAIGELDVELIEQVILPYPNGRSMDTDLNHNIQAPSFLTVSPNPSNGRTPVGIAIQLPEGADGGFLQVFDPTGRVIVEKAINGRVQLIDLATNNLSTGLYLASVSADGIPLQQAKFEVIE